MSVKQRPLGNQRVIVGVLPHVTIIKNNGTSLTSWDVPANAPPWNRRSGERSTISSQSGVDGRFRPCTHVKEKYFTRPLSDLPEFLYWRSVSHLASAEKHSYGYEMMARVHRYRYTQFTAACDAMNLSLSPTQWNALGAQALSTMLPSFSGENSYLNYLFELKDFKDVIKYLDNRVGSQLMKLRSLGVKIKKGSNRPISWFSRRYLEYQFGWRPLFNDIVSFYQQTSGFFTRFEELVKRANTQQQSYWGTWISGTESSDALKYTNNGDGIGAAGIGYGQQKVLPFVTQLGSKGVRFHATVRYRYPLPPELAGVSGRLKAFLDVLGLNANPAIIWNAIPFSFMVDWMSNVSGYLNRLRVDNIHFKTEITDFCTSAKVTGTVEYAVQGYQSTYSDTPVGYLGPKIVMDTCTKSIYERRLGLPNFLTAIQTSGLNSREFLLTGALAGANSRRR